MYHYFVSYTFSDHENHSLGFACCEIERNFPITQMSDIQEIVVELLALTPETKELTILSYQLLRETASTKKRREKH